MPSRREAKKAAQQVFGVISVDNQLQVRLMNDQKRADAADLRGDVLQALMLDGFVPTTIDATVEDGFVTRRSTSPAQRITRRPVLGGLLNEYQPAA